MSICIQGMLMWLLLLHTHTHSQCGYYSRCYITIETGGQKIMWCNQQEAWWCNALQLPLWKMLWNPSVCDAECQCSLLCLLLQHSIVSQPPKPIDSPGRSGARFFNSYDRRVVMKSITSEEVALVHQILQPYHAVSGVCIGSVVLITVLGSVWIWT